MAHLSRSWENSLFASLGSATRNDSLCCFVFFPTARHISLFSLDFSATSIHPDERNIFTHCTQQMKQQQDYDLFSAAAADRPNSSSSSTQRRRRHGSRGGQLRASEPPIVRLMTPCLGGCASYRERTRCTHTKQTKVSTIAHSRRNNSTTNIRNSSRHTQLTAVAQYAAAAVAQQRWRPATS